MSDRGGLSVDFISFFNASLFFTNKMLTFTVTTSFLHRHKFFYHLKMTHFKKKSKKYL